ncbi:MAG: hypothetical protein AAF526_10535 [Pseudomonadota bacterium]
MPTRLRHSDDPLARIQPVVPNTPRGVPLPDDRGAISGNGEVGTSLQGIDFPTNHVIRTA